MLSHACFLYRLLLCLWAQAFHIKSVFPPKTNLSKKTRRTKASRTHETKTTHQVNSMSCSCNLYILKMREADRKTGNYTKEFTPKVVIKIGFKNAHYKHLVRQYIHSRSQVCRLRWERSLQDGEQQGSLHPELMHFLFLLTLLSLQEPRKGLKPKHISLSGYRGNLDKSLFRCPEYVQLQFKLMEEREFILCLISCYGAKFCLHI